jgi:hypothetical protein
MGIPLHNYLWKGNFALKYGYSYNQYLGRYTVDSEPELVVNLFVGQN